MTNEGPAPARPSSVLGGCRHGWRRASGHQDGETIEEAIENGKDALDGLITTLRELGRDIPEPGSNTINASGKFMLRLPKSLHASLIKSAKEENVSMNTLAVTLIAQGLAPKNPSIIQGPASDFLPFPVDIIKIEFQDNLYLVLRPIPIA